MNIVTLGITLIILSKYLACVNVFLLLCMVVSDPALLLGENSSQSCVDIGCSAGYDRSRQCQCNDECFSFNNCCPDYRMVCRPDELVCDSTLEISNKLWNDDINRLPDNTFVLNYQGWVPEHSFIDNATNKLFTRLDESQLSGPTYQAYINLLDNYEPVKAIAEDNAFHEVLEVNHFLDEILKTKVIATLLEHLKCIGQVRDQNELRNVLNKLWFQGYPRSGKAVIEDTSGFEHVMVGEFKNQDTVNGLHGWLSFYLKEKAGCLDYRGYVRKHKPHLVGASFTWEGRSKSLGSMMVGTSPEFDLAIFTLCYLTSGRSPCQTNLGGHDITILTYSSNGHVATAFMVA